MSNRVADALRAWATQLDELADKLDAAKGSRSEPNEASAEVIPPGSGRSPANVPAMSNALETNTELQPCYRGNDWCPRGCCSHLWRKS